MLGGAAGELFDLRFLAQWTVPCRRHQPRRPACHPIPLRLLRSHLTLTANPSHLKYLLRRLHVRLPRNVPITVGIWPAGETQLLDDRMRAALGASFYANSLQEAVTVCLNAASERAADALSLAVAA